MENQATGSRKQDSHGNGKFDALLGIDNKRAQNKTIAYQL